MPLFAHRRSDQFDRSAQSAGVPSGFKFGWPQAALHAAGGRLTWQDPIPSHVAQIAEKATDISKSVFKSVYGKIQRQTCEGKGKRLWLHLLQRLQLAYFSGAKSCKTSTPHHTTPQFPRRHRLVTSDSMCLVVCRWPISDSGPACHAVNRISAAADKRRLLLAQGYGRPHVGRTEKAQQPHPAAAFSPTGD